MAERDAVEGGREGGPRAPRPRRSPARLATIGMLVAVLAVSSQLAIPVPGLEAPFTLQTLAIMLVALLLGAEDGAACLAVYVAAGAIGLPVFAGGKAGLGGPTTGFLLGFIGQAWLTGRLAAPGAGPLRLYLACVAGLVPTYALGALGLILLAGMPVRAAALTVLPFLPGALFKALLAILLYRRLLPALPAELRVEPR